MKRKITALLICISTILSLIIPVNADVLEITGWYDEAGNTLSITIAAPGAEDGTSLAVSLQKEDGEFAFLKEMPAENGKVQCQVLLPAAGTYVCKVRWQDTQETMEKTIAALSGIEEALTAALKEAVRQKDAAACEAVLEGNEDVLGIKMIQGTAALLLDKETADSFQTAKEFAALYMAYAIAAKLNAANEPEVFTNMLADGAYAGILALDSVLPRIAEKNAYAYSAAGIQAAVAETVIKKKDYESLAQVQEKITQEILFQTLGAKRSGPMEAVLGGYTAVGLLDIDWEGFEDLNATKRRIVLEAVMKPYTAYKKIEEDFANALRNAQKEPSPTRRPSQGGGSGGGVSVGVTNQPGPTSTPGPVFTPEPLPEPRCVFNDMENTKWAIEAVECLYRRGVISGVGDGVYAPERTITRAEFTKMLMNLVDAQDSDVKLPFADVAADSWAYPHIAKAYANGIVYGIAPDWFGGGACVTREQAAVFLERLMSKFESNKPDPGLNVFAEFDDMADASDWAKDSILYLLRITMLKGKENSNFKPKDDLTRAEAAAMFYSYLVVLGKEGR